MNGYVFRLLLVCSLFTPCLRPLYPPSGLLPPDNVCLRQDWIKSRDFDDDSGVAGTGPGGQGHTATEEDGVGEKKAPTQWIRAPNDVTLRNAPCPICQEKFESTWSEDVQDWIWQDALKVGNRVYHASCYAEVTKDSNTPVAVSGAGGGARAGTPSGRTGTPDSVLGKRKAEVSTWFMSIV